MAKISPVSIKYMIHANFVAEGALEKPDIIGAIFGQTEGLLGADLEMRELQKEGKIGRIEVDVERSDKKTQGIIKIPTALDQSETTLIAAAIETIERIGPCDAQIDVERIEDVRGSKRDYIIERAKKLMQGIEGSTDSRAISNEIKDSAKIAEVSEYGESKLPCGDLSGNEIIVVEGRADVLNLMRNGVKNVISMNGTKLPDEIKELSKTKEITLFVDGDRGGKLIAQNVCDNAKVKHIAIAPQGKEVEELTGKEILMHLRKKVSPEEFFSFFKERKASGGREVTKEKERALQKIAQKIDGSKNALLLDHSLHTIREISARGIAAFLRRNKARVFAIVMDGAATTPIVRAAEDNHVKAIVAKNFGTHSERITFLGF